MVYAATAETVPIGYYSIQTSPTAARATTYLGDGTSGLFVWGAQMTTGVTTAYIPTTTAAVSVEPTANTARLDYLGSTCGKLLLEPQRTNLVTYSEQINTGFITAQGGTGLLPVITANNAISPDGYQNADTIVFNAGAGTTSSDISAIYQVFGGTTATYTCSFYAKTPSGTAQIQVRIDGSNYEKFTITNEWQRFTLTRALTGTSNALDFAIRRGLNEPMNASATIQLWGVQIELGAYATSYIPTLGAAVTRGNELASKSSINALIGGTSGTIFFEIKTNKTLTSNNYKQFFYYTDAAGAQAYMYLDGDNVLILNPSLGSISSSISLAADTTYKVAVAYATNDFKLYINGVERGSSASGTTINAVNLISLGSYVGTSEFNEFVFSQYIHFPTRLTNSQLAELTA